MFVPEVSRATYATKEDLAEDVVHLLRDELVAAAHEGAAFVQFDEPIVSELAFASGSTRTFMCAALAARKDPAEELDFAVSLMNRVVEGVTGVRIGVHVCRGNWSRDERTLLRGGYRPLASYLDRLHVSQLVLEYATERAGELMRFDSKELGLGVVNPRTEVVESSEEICRAVDRALELYTPERIFLNPDCGFGTLSGRPMNRASIAVATLRSMAAAARVLLSSSAFPFTVNARFRPLLIRRRAEALASADTRTLKRAHCDEMEIALDRATSRSRSPLSAPALEVVGLSKRYGDRQALDDVDLVASPGQRT